MKRVNVMILIVSVLVGMVFSMQSKIVDGNYIYVSSKVLQEYSISIESEEKEIESLKELEMAKELKIESYLEIIEAGGALKGSMEKELEDIMMQAGITDVEGPGIVVHLDDGIRELYEGEDPRNIIIHDIDILNVVNELKIAGAEALSINGQRLLPTTEMNCSGHSIRINNQFLAQPFIIKAIGDPKMLEAAIIAPRTYGELLVEYGLDVRVEVLERVEIKGYSEEIDAKYLEFVEESEGE